VARALLGSTARRMAGATPQQSLARLLFVHKQLHSLVCTNWKPSQSGIKQGIGMPGPRTASRPFPSPEMGRPGDLEGSGKPVPARLGFQKDRIVSSLLRSELSVKALA
jgi:hypothetical protein